MTWTIYVEQGQVKPWTNYKRFSILHSNINSEQYCIELWKITTQTFNMYKKNSDKFNPEPITNIFQK